jgi:NADH-quinone oxidoreductase subunit H
VDLEQRRAKKVCDRMALEELTTLFQLFLFPGFLFLFSLAFFSEWVDRKLVAKFQNRYGPLYTGPKGILQPLADFLKLLAKEDIVPAAADRSLFASTPILVLALSLTPLFLIPIADYSALVWFEGDLMVIMFMMTMAVIAMFLGAWASTDRFAVLGGMRLGLQMLGYEIPLVIAMIGTAIAGRSLSVSGIVQSQVGGPWHVMTQPLGFGVTLVCLLAHLQQVPFDIPEAESEIVAGWLVEFSGKKLALLRMAKNLELVLAGSLLVSLYLGGPLGFWLPHPSLYFFLKLVLCIFILSNLRALFARFRIDQVLAGAWKYLVPLALLQIVLVVL